MAIALMILGLLLMLFGGAMLAAWVGGKSDWFDSSVFDRHGSSKIDRQFLQVYFLAAVIAPLLIGAILLVYGLKRLLQT